MKKTIILTALCFMVACAMAYNTIQIPYGHSSVSLKLPKDMPDFTKFDRKWMSQISNYICCLHFKDTKTEALYTLVVECYTNVIIGLANCNCEEGNEKDTEYYIYRNPSGIPEQVTAQEFTLFLAEHDPEWKDYLEREKQKNEKNSINNNFSRNPFTTI